MKLNVEVVEFKQIEQEIDLPFYVKQISRTDKNFQLLIFNGSEKNLKLKIFKFSEEKLHNSKTLEIENSFDTIFGDTLRIENIKRLNHIVSKLLSVKDDMYEQLTKEQFEEEIQNILFQ